MTCLMKMFAVLFAVAALAVVGCGGRTAIKTEQTGGVVTYKGAPIEGATVTFSPKAEGGGSGAVGLTDVQGRYKLQTLLGESDAGTTPGDYNVTVSKSKMEPTGATIKEPDGTTREVTKPVSLLPKKYDDSRTTPLSATVVKGKNTFDFDLVD
ncbi:MAG: carboxypeptidase-like regulatory domain-containing protein [Thermoguttaceae bacterium]